MGIKILAFSDMHGNKPCLADIKKKLKREEKKKKPVDYIVCCGDFTVFETKMKTILSWINKLGKPVILIHGNHEEARAVRKLCKLYKNLTFIHKKIHRVKDDIVFVAYGGGGFSMTDRKFTAWGKKIMRKVKKKEKVILLTHGPPYGTKLDLVIDEHVGNKAYTQFVKKYKPTLYLSGHIHECFGNVDKIKKTTLLNPGPFGVVLEVK